MANIFHLMYDTGCKHSGTKHLVFTTEQKAIDYMTAYAKRAGKELVTRVIIPVELRHENWGNDQILQFDWDTSRNEGGQLYEIELDKESV